MASTRKSSRSKAAARGLAARVTARLREHVKRNDHLVVALSGGVDSVVLLDCLRGAVRQQGFRLSALHVDHQLSPNARHWAAFCRRLCAARGIPFRSVRVEVRRKEGVEAGARVARYAVFAREDCDYIALAHHQDDQVETLLLQLLRGAGVRGLAGMSVLREAQGNRQTKKGARKKQNASPAMLRPLLDVTRAEILGYARARRLKWVEDESNRDIRLARNYLRHEVLPVIARRFPAYRETLARAARHLADAACMLEGLAGRDAGGAAAGGTLAAEAVRRLPPARARNLLRHFLAGHGVRAPGAARLDEALRQVATANRDARVRVELDGASLRLYRGALYVVRSARGASGSVEIEWNGQRRVPLPGQHGVLTLSRTKGRGVSLARLRGRPVTVRLRRGGERLQPDPRRPRRTLKKLLQEARVPPWRRECLPLLYCGDDLVWAAGVGVDSAYQAQKDEEALRPAWTGGSSA